MDWDQNIDLLSIIGIGIVGYSFMSTSGIRMSITHDEKQVPAPTVQRHSDHLRRPVCKCIVRQIMYVSPFGVVFDDGCILCCRSILLLLSVIDRRGRSGGLCLLWSGTAMARPS